MKRDNGGAGTRRPGTDPEGGEIASQHAAAPDSGATDWPAILDLHDQLLELNPSPVVALNRAVALARVEGPDVALAALAEIEDHPAVAGYYLFHATRGELLRESGRSEAAAHAFRRALTCPASGPKRRFLETQLAGCGSR